MVAGVFGGVFLFTRTIWSHTGRAFARKLESMGDAAVQTVDAVEGSEPGPRGGGDAP